MPRHDEPTPARDVPAETLVLVQTKPTLRVLAVSSDRAALLRELDILCGTIRETRGARAHAWHIQTGVMNLG